MVRSNLVIAGSNFIFAHIKENYSNYLKEANISPFEQIHINYHL